jgi:hypothetical protein
VLEDILPRRMIQKNAFVMAVITVIVLVGFSTRHFLDSATAYPGTASTVEVRML